MGPKTPFLFRNVACPAIRVEAFAHLQLLEEMSIHQGLPEG